MRFLTIDIINFSGSFGTFLMSFSWTKYYITRKTLRSEIHVEHKGVREFI